MSFLLQLMLMGQTCPGGAECVPIHPPCELNVSLQTSTVATIPANRARTKLGVGEQTQISLIPAPQSWCSIIWIVFPPDGGSLSQPSNTSSVTFTAAERAKAATVTAWVGDVPFSVVYTIVEPASETGHKLAEFIYPAGTAGLDHPASATWIPLNMANAAEDEAALEETTAPSQWSFGTFQWAIPVRWKVGEGAEATLPDRIQTFQMHNSSGTITVGKMGASVTRSP